MAEPAEDIVAMVASELVQVTWEVIVAVEPSEKVPVALNCCAEPTAKLAGYTGVTAIEDNEATTVRANAGLVTPDINAVILTLPAATPVAKPAEDIVAMVVSELVQIT